MLLAFEHIKKALDRGDWKARKDDQPISSGDLTINTNSVNVTLGNIALRPSIRKFVIDLHDPESVRWEKLFFDQLVIYPYDFFLLYVQEAIDCAAPLFIDGKERYFAPMIEGRSTPARCGLSIHETAGFSEHGFGGNFTLEVSSKMPVIVRPGDEIAQVYFKEVSSGKNPYNSVYSDQSCEPKPPVLGRERFQR